MLIRLGCVCESFSLSAIEAGGRGRLSAVRNTCIGTDRDMWNDENLDMLLTF